MQPANDPAHVSEQVWAEIRCNERFAVLSGEDDVREQVSKSVGHSLTPLRGLQYLNSTTRPTAHAVGYFLPPVA